MWIMWGGCLGFPPSTIVHCFGLLSYNDPPVLPDSPIFINDEATDVAQWIEKLQVMDFWRQKMDGTPKIGEFSPQIIHFK